MPGGRDFVRLAPSPPTRAASAVYVTLAAQLTSLSGLVIFEEARGRRLASQIAALGGDPRASGAEAVVGAVTVFAILIMLVVGTTVAAAAAYLTWLVRARQANSRSAPPGPVFWGWLIPGINLLAPARLVDEVWRGAKPPFDRRGRWLALVGAWWVSWLAALALVADRLLLDNTPGDLTGFGVAELGVIAVAALLCAVTVRDITRIQAAPTRHRLLLTTTAA